MDLSQLGPTETRIDIEGSGRFLLRGRPARGVADFELRVVSTGSVNAPTIVSIPAGDYSDEHTIRISSTAMTLNLQARVTALLHTDTNIDVEVRHQGGVRRACLIRDGKPALTSQQLETLIGKE